MFVVFAVAFCCCITPSNVECLCYLFVLVCMEFHHSMRQNGRCLCTHPVAVPSVGRTHCMFLNRMLLNQWKGRISLLFVLIMDYTYESIRLCVLGRINANHCKFQRISTHPCLCSSASLFALRVLGYAPDPLCAQRAMFALPQHVHGFFHCYHDFVDVV